jgi:hypothetical protein
MGFIKPGLIRKLFVEFYLNSRPTLKTLWRTPLWHRCLIDSFQTQSQLCQLKHSKALQAHSRIKTLNLTRMFKNGRPSILAPKIADPPPFDWPSANACRLSVLEAFLTFGSVL